jgi:hypothetical protein
MTGSDSALKAAGTKSMARRIQSRSTAAMLSENGENWNVKPDRVPGRGILRIAGPTARFDFRGRVLAGPEIEYAPL